MSKVKVERLGELECQCFVGNYAINVMYFERDSLPMAIPSKRLCVENARMTREALKWTNLIGTWDSNASDKKKEKGEPHCHHLVFWCQCWRCRPRRKAGKKILIWNYPDSFCENHFTFLPVRIRCKGEKRHRADKMVIR